MHGNYGGNLKEIEARILQHEARALCLREVLKAHHLQGGLCRTCGAGPLDNFSAHHAKPRRVGGPDVAENFEIVCGNTCHSKREMVSLEKYPIKNDPNVQRVKVMLEQRKDIPRWRGGRWVWPIVGGTPL